MRSDRLLHYATRRHAAAIQCGAASPYDCLRFFEQHFHYDGDDRDELLRRATLTLARHDPLLLATSPYGQYVRGLTDADVEDCIAAWSLDDACMAAFLEGHLWMATVNLRSPERARVARALVALERAAPGFVGDRQHLELFCEALRILGDSRYPAAFDAMLDSTPPEWRSHHLVDAMRAAVDGPDWTRYDALRSRWAAMPRNSHVCECAINFVANIDGLRALHRGDTDGAVGFLRQAVAVNGCPHLNTGAASLRLARELLDRGQALPEVADHVRAVEQFHASEATAALKQRLAALGHHDGA